MIKKTNPHTPPRFSKPLIHAHTHAHTHAHAHAHARLRKDMYTRL